jgi:hypothetical protein
LYSSDLMLQLLELRKKDGGVVAGPNWLSRGLLNRLLWLGVEIELHLSDLTHDILALIIFLGRIYQIT